MIAVGNSDFISNLNNVLLPAYPTRPPHGRQPCYGFARAASAYRFARNSSGDDANSPSPRWLQRLSRQDKLKTGIAGIAASSQLAAKMHYATLSVFAGQRRGICCHIAVAADVDPSPITENAINAGNFRVQQNG